MTVPALGPFDIDRVFRAIEKQWGRLHRSAKALERAQLPYAIIGGSAVALWVSRFDDAAVQVTSNVDVLLRRRDLAAAQAALEDVGFHYLHAAVTPTFLDGPKGRCRDALRIVYEGELFHAHSAAPAPDVEDSEPFAVGRVLSLEPLVRMKLAAFRRIDRGHIRDMIDVGLIDTSWTSRLPQELASRLQELLDDPDG